MLLPVEELGTGRSEIRNRVLAPIFKELKLIEAWGSGIQKIREELDQYPEIEGLILQEVGQCLSGAVCKKRSGQGRVRAESGQSQGRVRAEWRRNGGRVTSTKGNERINTGCTFKV